MPSLVAAEHNFPVYIFVDEEYRSDPYWSSNLKTILYDADLRYRQEFDISFSWQEPALWESNNTHKNIFELLDQLVEDTAVVGSDMIIGITGQTPLEGNELGVARFFSGHILIKQSDYMTETVVHEIGHIFGAVHVEGSPFLMNAVYSGEKYLPFDIWNSKIIPLHAQRKFQTIEYPISTDNAISVTEIYQDILNFGRSDTALYINFGSVLSAIGKHEDAIQILREAETYFYLESLAPDADNAKGEENLKKARESLGFASYRAGLYQDAVGVLENLHEISPESNTVQWYLAASYTALERYYDAKDLFEKLFTRLPESAPVVLSLGYVYEKMDIFSMAEEYYYEATRLAPDNFKGFAYLGYLYMLQKQWDKAIDYLSEAVSRNSDNSKLYESLGVAFHEQGKHHEALEQYTAALKILPQLQTARYNGGLIYYNAGDLARAEKEFKQLISFHKDALGYQALGMIYLKQKDIQKAKKKFEKAVKLNKKLSDSYANLYYIYRQLGQEKKAKKAAKRFRKLTGKEIGSE